MKIGIIGFGHLAKSLLSGLLKSGHPADDIFVYARRGEVCAEAESFGVHASSDLAQVVADSETFFIVIKGAGFDELFSSLPQGAISGKNAVSFMAGVGMERLCARLEGASVTYAIPSIAIASCEGIVAYSEAPKSVEDIFAGLGFPLKVAPEKMDAVTAYASCGVGFAAYLLDAYYKAGIDLGFSPEESRRITDITFRNALSCDDFAETVTAVATKGGITECGVNYMNGHEVFKSISGGVNAAYEKMKK